MGLASRDLPFTILYPRFSTHARVVKWQTRTFEGRMPQGMGVQVPPRALSTTRNPLEKVIYRSQLTTLTERAVEIPWALAHHNGGDRILEVGCSFAYENPEYVAGLKALGARELHGIDISSAPAPDFIKRTADIRASGYPSDFFDTVFCVSTIEHIGRDNDRHYSPVAEIDARDAGQDEIALAEMLRITRPGGTLIVTLPFGRFEDHGWFFNYDAPNVDRLFRHAPARVEEYFRFTPDGWVACDRDELAGTGYGENGAPAAAGVACFAIGKT